MQTFLPFKSFEESASVLDRQRLGKQRVEVLQLLSALAGTSRGWRNHPAAKMWEGFEPLLIDYGLAICAAWRQRGYIDNCAPRIAAYDETLHFRRKGRTPLWLGDAAFHRAHRSNLTRKNPEWYAQFWDEPPDLPYIWPAHQTERT